MKIIKESKKEKLPVSFLTNFISRGWERVGDFKEEIAAVEQSFSSTQTVTKIMQDLIDAYLVAIGQMEGLLEEKKYLEVPEGAVGLNEDIDALLRTANMLTEEVDLGGNTEVQDDFENIKHPKAIKPTKDDLEIAAEDMLDVLIMDEKEAIDGYTDALESEAAMGLSPKAKEVLKHINSEEVEHIEELAKIAAGDEEDVKLDHGSIESAEGSDDNFVLDFDDIEVSTGPGLSDREIERMQGISNKDGNN